MTDWIAILDELAERGESSVLLTVAGVRGSAPRETGAKMIVTATQTIGSIGGGQLEYQCAQKACETLRAGEVLRQPTAKRRYALGSNCGQCCGGVVEVLYEYLPGSKADWLTELRRHHHERRPVIMVTSCKGEAEKRLVTAGDEEMSASGEPIAAARDLLESGGLAAMSGDWLLEPVRPSDFHVAIFGAGHVGAAAVDVLSRLDCHLRWIDNRRHMFPASLPANVTAVESAVPAREVAAMPAGACFVVMTQSHPLDLEICTHILRRGDAAYCGLIGSRSKRRRFERLLHKQGMLPGAIAKLVCPIGVPGIGGKQPVEIALALAAELLQVRYVGSESGSERIVCLHSARGRNGRQAFNGN